MAALVSSVALLAVTGPTAPLPAPDLPGDAQPFPLVAPPTITFVAPTVQGHGVRWWANRSRAWHARTLALHRTLLHQPSVVEAINLACVVYGNCDTLWRKARCESHLYRYAANAHSSARGLFQFLTTPHGGTWATTPFARFSVYSPYANALAAGWMHRVGRGGEWQCR